MAVLDAVPGLSVSVCIDKKEVEEYVDVEEPEISGGAVAQYQAARTVWRYVEAISEKEFSIKICLDKGYVMSSPSIKINIDVDGKTMARPSFRKASYPAYFKGDIVIKPYVDIKYGTHVPGPEGTRKEFLRRFKFAKIETTIEDEQLNCVKQDARDLEKVGEFTVTVWRGSEPVERKDITRTVHRSSHRTRKQLKVHEKALKGQAKTHSTILGLANEPYDRPYHDSRTKRLDGIDYPLATFRFKYRSREALQSLLIIPRAPSPELEPAAPIDLQNLDADQRVKVEQFLRDLNSSGNDSSSSAARATKRERDHDERGTGSRKKRTSGEMITIDLTADADSDEGIIALN